MLVSQTWVWPRKTSSEKNGASVLNLTKPLSANRWMCLEADSSPKPPEKYNLGNTLISALWDPKLRTQFKPAQTSELQNCKVINQCFFSAARVAQYIVICYAAVKNDMVRFMKETILYIRRRKKKKKEIKCQFQNADSLVVPDIG